MLNRLCGDEEVWLHLFFKDHQPTGRLAHFLASRERRLNSIVADATGKNINHYRGFQPTAKFKRR